MKNEFKDYLNEGKVYYKKNDLEKSIDSYTKAIDIDLQSRWSAFDSWIIYSPTEGQ